MICHNDMFDKLKISLSGIIHINDTSENGEFTENEKHLVNIIRSLQEELIKSQNEMTLYKNMASEFRAQLASIHKLINLAMSENNDEFYNTIEEIKNRSNN